MNLDSCKAWTPTFAEVYVKSEVIDETEPDGNVHSDLILLSNGIDVEPPDDDDFKAEIDVKEHAMEGKNPSEYGSSVMELQLAQSEPLPVTDPTVIAGIDTEGEKNYCQLCPFKTSQRANLLQHTKTHYSSIANEIALLVKKSTNKDCQNAAVNDKETRSRIEPENSETFTLKKSKRIQIQPLSDDIKKTETYEGHDELVNGRLDNLPIQCDEEIVEPCTPLDCQQKYVTIKSQHEINMVQSTSSYQESRDRLMDENLSSIQTVEILESSPVKNVHRSNMEGDVEKQIEYLFPCNVCSYKANTHSMLNNHLLGHTSEIPAFDKSSVCNMKSSANLVGRNVTAAKKLYCKVCSFETVHISHLKRHNLIHTGEKAFACEFCPYKSNQKSNLKCHILIHTAEKPFACGLCSFKTNAQRNLNNHILTHTGDKPFACELCSYKTNQKSHLKLHLLKHTTEKAFACEVCSYKTNDKSCLNRHVLTHKGEKPFACGLCSYKTKQKSCLNRHLLIHRGDKPFACEFCSYKANRKSNLRCHLLSHTG